MHARNGGIDREPAVPKTHHMTTEIDTADILAKVTARLREKFPECSAEEVEEVVKAELDRLNDCPVRDYLEVLTERSAKKRLKGVEQAA